MTSSDPSSLPALPGACLGGSGICISGAGHQFRFSCVTGSVDACIHCLKAFAPWRKRAFTWCDQGRTDRDLVGVSHSRFSASSGV